jgi:glycosyltransferase involved in cell wall biosynthesis
MKIGINISFLRKSGTGIGQVTHNFILKLCEIKDARYRMQDIQFVLYSEEPADIQLPENFKIKTFLPRWWKRDDLLRKWLWERELATRAAEDGCDVFLSLYQSSTVFPTSLIPHHLSSAIKHTMIVHDIIPKLFPEYRGNSRQEFYWKRIERGIRAADHIVAISENTKNDLIHTLNISKEKISVAYLDVAPRFNTLPSEEVVADVLKKYGLAKGYIYHGGGLEVRKNAETLLRAYKSLGDKMPDTIVPPLVISGKIFDKTNKLATDVYGLVEELGLQEKVKLLDFVSDEDLPSLYRGALFFVYPSLCEGFGLPVLEALRMNVPVLTSNASALPEVGGEAALYADPRNVEEMTLQMKRLLTDEALRATLISQGAVQAVKFNWNNFVEKVLEYVYAF